MINSGNSGGTITIYIYSGAPYPAGRDYSQSITKSQYTDVVSRLGGWMDSAGYFPNYWH